MLQRGFDLSTADREPGLVPVVSSSGITGYHSTAPVKGPGVVTGRYGTIGKVFYVKSDFWPLNTTLWVKDFKGNDPEFVAFLLRTIDFHSCSDKSSVPGVNRNDLHCLLVDLPPLSEQQSIAEVLRTLDDKIEINRQMNQNLESIARTIFRSWFVAFDPVVAKADGRQPFGMTPEVSALFPDRFVQNRDASLPQGWESQRWGDISTLEYGKSLRNYQGAAGTVPVYGTNGKIGWHTEALCSTAGILIGRKGAYRGVHYSHVPFFAIDTAFYLKPTRPLEILWAYFELLQLDINGMDSGSAIPSTSREDFYQAPVLFPPYPIQQEFARIAGPMFRRMEANREESKTLAALRDTLLPKLMSGELRVRDAERTVGAHV